MVSHHPSKFDGLRHPGSGDIMFLAVEEQDSICFHLNPPLMFMSV